MLDIRATHYVSPVSEVPFESVPLTVHLVNVADETGLLSGAFRVYNDTTGLLIFWSDIAPLSLAAGAGVDVSSLTEFDPPAPLDDTYFVIFDGIASNALVPNGIVIHLGAFHFDVTPVGMGPAPAAHHATHEAGGSDPIEPADLGTSELDTTLHLKPDGAGGVHWVTGITGFDHGALTGLDDDDHTQYRLREQVIIELECLNYASLTTFKEFYNAALGSGTIGTYSFPNHPGVFAMYSSVTANSGRSLVTSDNTITIAGGETVDVILRPQVLLGTTIRLGLVDTTSSSDCVDGAYIEMAQVGGVDGVVVGKTANNSARSTTGTNFTLTTNTWYRFRTVINQAATRVDFYVYSEAGALLWTDNLTTNIPTGAGRYTGAGVVATHAPTSAVLLCDVDYIRLVIAKTLVR